MEISKLELTCEKIETINPGHYDMNIDMRKISHIEISNNDIPDLVELVGMDRILDFIGEDKARDYFGIEDEDAEE